MLSSSSTNGFETDLGARVRTLRRERGLTLKGLGRLAGLSHPFLSQVERGLARPSVGSVERIAAALDVSVAQLWSPPRSGERSTSSAATRARSTSDGLRELGGEPRRRCASGPPRTRRWPEERRRSSTARSRSTSPAARSRSTSAATVHALDEGDTLRFDGSVPHRLRRTGGTSTAR